MPTTGQLFIGTDGGLGDTRVAYYNQGTTTPQFLVLDNASGLNLLTPTVEDVAIDSAAGFYYAIVHSGEEGARLVRGSVTGGAITVLADYRNNIADTTDDTIVYSLQIDPANGRLYVGMQNNQGAAPAQTGIRSYSYNSAGAITDLGFLTTVTSSGKPLEGGFSVLWPYNMDLNTTTNTLFWNELLNGGAVDSIGVFRLNTSTPNTIVQVVSQVQFPDNGSQGLIYDVEADNATDVLYFTATVGAPSPGAYNAAQDQIWYVTNASTATNATAVALTLFDTNGTTNFRTVGLGTIFFPQSLTLDQSTRQLYVTSENFDNGTATSNDDRIYVFQLNAAGTQGTLVNTIFPTFAGNSANITALAFNSLPTFGTFTGTASAALEQSSAVVATASASIADDARLNAATVQITGGTFTSTQAGVNNDNLAVGAGLQTSGLVAGTNITISYTVATRTLSLTGYDTLANYQSVLASVRYFSTGDNPTNYGANTTRTITWTLNDGAINLTANSLATTTTTINVTGVNDAPVFAALSGDSVTTTEAGGSVPNVKIDAGGNATIADLDGLNFNGGSIRFAITAGLAATQDQLNFDTAGATTVTTGGGNVSVGGTVIGTFTGGGAGGGDLLVSLNASATPAAVQTLIRAVDFANTGGGNPTAGARTVTITLNDGGGTANGGVSTVVATTTVNVAAVDTPPTAVADSPSGTETATFSFAVVTNDTDPDGGPKTIVNINGTANPTVGQIIVLASGATVSLRADGGIDYNPNGAFNYLISTATAAVTGASNTSAIDTFTYGLNGGSSTTVSVTVNGVDGPGDELRGTPFNDNITGTVGSDIIKGLASDDFILGGGGNDNIDGGDGNDVIRAAGGNDTIAGGLGRDLIFAGDGNDTLDGGTGLSNELAGGAGDDTYNVNAVGDTVIEAVGEGTDIVLTSLASFVLTANVENLTNTGGSSFVGIGNALDNVITGGAGFDNLNGGDGNDRLIGGSSVANELIGGLGNDTYVVGAGGDSVIELFGQGTDTVETALASHSLAANVENLTYTGIAAFIGIGNGLDNVLIGGGARDTLSAGGGNDTLDGGAGIANELIGGTGDDTYIVRVAGDTIIEAVGEGTDTVQTALASHTLSTNVENLTFTGAGAFIGVGNASDNVIAGGASADFLSGLNGNDTLIGGSGADTLLGGAGTDTFRYLGGETGFDRILDFTSGSDKISLSATGFTQIGTLTFQTGTAATTANSTFLYNSATGIVSYDADGNGAGAAVQLAQLNAGLSLTLADFIIA